MLHSALNDDVTGIGQDREFPLSMNTLVSQWLLPLHYLSIMEDKYRYDYHGDVIININQIIPQQNIKANLVHWRMRRGVGGALCSPQFCKCNILDKKRAEFGRNLLNEVYMTFADIFCKDHRSTTIQLEIYTFQNSLLAM